MCTASSFGVALGGLCNVMCNHTPPFSERHVDNYAKMLQIKNHIKYCSLAIAATIVFSSGPVTNPVVYFVITTDNESLGRIIIEMAKVSYIMLKYTEQKY